MQTKIGTALAHGSAAEVIASITGALDAQLKSAPPVLVMTFASTKQPLGEITSALKQHYPNACVLGATTAGEFTEHGDSKSSVSAFALAGDFVVHAGLARGLKASPEKAVAEAVERLPRAVPGYAHKTAIVLLDPLAGNGEEASLLITGALGTDTPLAGGAAGDDLQMAATEVALDGESASDGVAIAVLFSKTKLGIGVAHGHDALSRPLKVTRAAGSVVHEVDGRPAWEVWREETRSRAEAAGFSGAVLSPEQEGPFLLHFEAGLALGDGYKIRAPLSKNADGSINFACGIEQGSMIRITESVPEKQVESARVAAQRAQEALNGQKAAGALIFDCICRNLILQSRFADAVKAMSKELGNVPVAGFETYGEIALEVGEMSGFHNTTSVVLAFPES